MDGTNSTLNYSWEIIKVFFYLGGVILLIYTLNYFFRNYRRHVGYQGSMIKIIDRGYLTQNAQVNLIQVGDHYYLIGVTDEKVTVLDSYDQSPELENSKVTTKSSPKFAEILMSKFSKRGGDGE